MVGFAAMSAFASLSEPTPEALQLVASAFAADGRSPKCDLGIGIYYDDSGRAPVMEAVKAAEQWLLEQETSKSYQAPIGGEGFLHGIAALLGSDTFAGRTALVQTVGGTGGVRLAIELAKMATPTLTVHVGTPTWPNHIAIPEALGLPLKQHRYYDTRRRRADVESIARAIDAAAPGDLFVFHGPCHNPTGADLGAEDYRALLYAAADRGVVPLIDTAYFGLGNALADDMQLLSEAAGELENAFIVLSCSKAFGLYRERTGALFTLTSNTAEARRVRLHLQNIARRTYSSAPSHGASVVAEILASAVLAERWRAELASMRERIAQLRRQIAARAPAVDALRHIGEHKGLFTMLPLSGDQVAQLARDHAMYLAPNGRANLAGLRMSDVERFCAAIAAVSAS
jgi:aromatic-amino-acid transaminase